ncbi:MAG TPA: hypothetical protein VJR30_00800, partial [Bradyrhizobium sp.]|nr:hypothetical protein [Bradyrhizobium sp.]
VATCDLMRAVALPVFPAERLLRKRFRRLFGGSGEVHGRQKGTDQHDEQVDFQVHVALRCAIAAVMQQCKGRSSRSALQWQWGAKKMVKLGYRHDSTF